MAGLPFGGGKAVVLAAPGQRPDALFESLGRAIHRLAGAYITAEDVGTTVADMQAVARSTRFVSGLKSLNNVAGGSPSPKTAYGVYLSIQEGWRYVSDSNLKGVRVAVQGLGAVGYHLCEHLHRAGARLWVSDLDENRMQRVQQQFAAQAVSAGDILAADVDVLAPCAMGAILNEQTIPTIQARLIAGGANNQLASTEDGERLRKAGILYAPDYIVNAGGIICAASEYLGQGSELQVRQRIEQIPTTLRAIIAQASAQMLPTNIVADRRARERLSKGVPPAGSRVAISPTSAEL
jgi:leucine dehydrogenase